MDGIIQYKIKPHIHFVTEIIILNKRSNENTSKFPKNSVYLRNTMIVYLGYNVCSKEKELFIKLKNSQPSHLLNKM